jgi:hypothetical protein
MRSARILAQRLETGVAAHILPYGMLGKAITGYRVTGLDNPQGLAPEGWTPVRVVMRQVPG